MSGITLVEKSIRLSLSIISLPLTLTQTVLSACQAIRYKPPGQLVEAGSGRLHTLITGHGSPTVILESGMGGGCLDWSLVQPEISGEATVLSYDRAGFGWSPQPLQQPTCRSYAEHLRRLLQELKLKPPYLLVGHSYGGMIMRWFAAEYPGEVMGLILVDAVHESHYLDEKMDEGRKKQRRNNKKQLRWGYLLSPVAIPRILKQPVGVKRLPERFQRIVRALGYRNQAYQAAYSELLCAQDSAVQLTNAPPLPPDLPITVLSAGKQSENWKRTQQELVLLSQQTQHIMVKDSWHSIHIHRPDVVISAIQSLLKAHS